MKIVLVDDSTTNLIILRNLCQKISGAECISFTDSEPALDFLQANEVSLVIVDYSMPKITGIELVKRVRKSPRHLTTAIVMVTGSSEIAVRNRALEVGVTDFFVKPIRPGQYLERLVELLAVARCDVLA